MIKSINDLSRHNEPLNNALNEAVCKVIASGWYVLGQAVETFERAFANYCGTSSCVSMANGTDALELALRALGIGEQDEVITVANAGGYSTAAILACGAIPRYVDISLDNFLLDLSAIPGLISSRTKAIIVTHLFGQAVAMDRVMEIADKAGISVIEDCAQAHGARWNGKAVGSWGAAGCFSFYPTKNLGALGDGGAVVSSDPEIVLRLKQLRQYGWGSKYRSVLPGGRNSRLDEMQAAILSVKLPYLDIWNVRRRAVAEKYKNFISNKFLTLPEVGGDNYVAHLYVVQCAERESLQSFLKEHGVPTDIHYPVPDYKQESIKARFAGLVLPKTEQACRQIITLPCFPEMTDEEIREISTVINAWSV